MQVFYKKLCASSQSNAPYLQALSAITKAAQTQIQTATSEFSWQSWTETENHGQA